MACHEGYVVKSVRSTAFKWIAAVLVPVGLAAAVIAHVAGREEADIVSDNLLVQIAQKLEPNIPVPSPPPEKEGPEDEVLIQVWDADGMEVRRSFGENIPRQTHSGLRNMIIHGVEWRIYAAHHDGRTIQISQRQEVRDEVAEHLAISAALPVLAALPIVWLMVAFALSRLFSEFDRAGKAVAERSVEASEPLSVEGMPAEMRSYVEAMNHLIRRQTAAIDQQRHFVSDAAHELRTPLTALQILVDTLSQRAARNPHATYNELLPELSQAVNRARALTDQLLKLAEVHSGKEMPVTADVDLQTALLQVVAGLVPAASAKSIEFAVNARVSATVHASPIDIATLLAVLVENAVRYSAAGSPIEVTLSKGNAEAIIEIADRGIGIPVEALPRIYDRFFRAAPQVEGSGLGLSIARAIADQYGFMLSIANRVGGGVVAAVTFRLPTGAGAN